MLSNTFIVSEFVEILYSFPTWSCVKMCHTIPPDNVSYGTTTSAFHLALCNMVIRKVYFTWQCVIRYHNQCISPGNVLCGTRTSAFYLAMCHAAPRPLQPSNMSCGTTTSVFHLEMCYVVPQPVYFTWQCVIRYQNLYISPGNLLYGTKTSVFHLAMCYAIPRPVYFIWQCVMHSTTSAT